MTKNDFKSLSLTSNAKLAELGRHQSGPQEVCAGLNPLPRTVQGNNPGTTACPPCAS